MVRQCRPQGAWHQQTFGRDLKAALPSLRTTQPRDADNRYRTDEGIGLEEGPP
jgi:hypothetical protein